MPSHSLKSCRAPGCPKLIRDGAYCPEHTRAIQQSYDRGRGTPAQRGYGSRWRRLRAMVLASQPVCIDPYHIHGAEIVVATEVDHRVPKSRGGDDTEENLQPLCKACHSRKTAIEDGRWGAGH